MKRVILFVVASLIRFVLMVPTEAQQRKKHKPTQGKGSQSQQSNKQDATNQSDQPATQEPVVVKTPPACISEERQKEAEEVKKRLGEVVRQILANPYQSPPSIDNEKRFSDAMQIANAVCKIREDAEMRLALHDKNFKKELLEKVSGVSTRMVAEFNARGRDASFSTSEKSLLKAYLTGENAADVVEKAASPKLTADLKTAQTQRATQTSKSVLTEFNEKAEAASFAADDEHLLEIFLTVVLARETIQKAHSPRLTKNLAKEVIRRSNRGEQSNTGRIQN